MLARLSEESHDTNYMIRICFSHCNCASLVSHLNIRVIQRAMSSSAMTLSSKLILSRFLRTAIYRKTLIFPPEHQQNLRRSLWLGRAWQSHGEASSVRQTRSSTFNWGQESGLYPSSFRVASTLAPLSCRPDIPFLLSPIDNAIPTIYMPKLLFFPVPEGHTDIAIQSFLHGLRSTFQAIPLLAGTIKAIPDGTAQVGTLGITSPWRTVDEIFTVKDLRKSKKYSYRELRKNGFPPASLPLWDFVNLRMSRNSNPPVMHVQITLIDGGIVLAPCIHHTFVDGAGSATILQTWAACCRGEIPFSDKPLSLWQHVTLLEGHEKVSVEEIPEYIYREKTPVMNQRSYVDDNSQRSRHSRSWLTYALNERFGSILRPMLMKLAIFSLTKYRSLFHSTRLIYFPHADLAKLKEMVKAAGEELEPRAWISTTDALSALLFCCVAQSRHTAKRSHRPSSSETSPLFTTFVNVRKQCNLPQNYIRNMFLPCSIQSSFNELTPSTRNLAIQAYKLRARLRGIDTAHVQRVASMIRSVPDVSKLTFMLANLVGKSQREVLVMTSWRDQGICDLDWGLQIGVKCERVRICDVSPDGMIYVFPEYSGSKIDGGLELAITLEKDVMKELERNEVFNRFAQWC